MLIRTLAALLMCLDGLAVSAATFTVTNTNASGPGSLAEAMKSADAIPNSKVAFSIVGTAPFVIDIATPLPVITVPVTIDGTTQPGYVGTTPVVTLISDQEGPVLDLETASALGAIVKALAFQLSAGPGIVTNRAYIDGCTFDRSGSPSAAETASVRFVHVLSSFIDLPSSTVYRSKFSFGTGVEIVSSSGISVDGSTFDACYGSAIAVKASSNIFIGSVVPVMIRRSIATGQPAISIDAASSAIEIMNTEIAGAFAGVDFAGTGLRVRAGTRIHDVDAWGIRVNGGQAADLSGASIYNVGAGATNGIVLANGGDHDLAPLTLTSAVVTPSGTTITGFVDATPGDGRALGLYASDSCSPPVGQRGLVWMSNIAGPFSVDLAPIKPGSYITALQERSLGPVGPTETSSFSECIVANGSADGPPPAITSVDYDFGEPGASVRISGSNFMEYGRVFFGATEAFDCNLGPANITCSAPPGSGTVDLAVENPDGKRAVKSAAFTYRQECNVFINSSSDDAVTNGSPVVLGAVASGEPPLTYQWYANGAVVTGATQPSLTVQPPRVPTVYRLLVTSACNGMRDVSMSVTPCAFGQMRIVVQPADTSAVTGTPAIVCVESSGVVSSYTWYDGAKGDTSRPLANGYGDCVKVTSGDTASVWARLSNACGSVDTRAATVIPLRRRAASK